MPHTRKKNTDCAEKSRAAKKGWLTRAAKHLENVTKNEDIVTLKDAIAEFDKRLEEFDKAQATVESMLDDSELESDLDEIDKIRKGVRIARIEAARKLDQLTETPKVATTAKAQRTVNAKLPKIELPKFSGKFTDWQTFWDSFLAIVDRTDMSGVNKFTYLISLLEGEPKSVIQGLPLTEANYIAACTMLKERYGRKERIIFAHIQGLLNLSILSQNKLSVKSLWTLQDTIMTHVRSLESLGVNGEEYGLFLTPMILSRLPNEIRMEWARNGANHESDLRWLLTFLRNEIERRERSDSFKEMNKSPIDSEKKKPVDVATEPQVPTASALLSTQRSSCVFCGKSHPSEKCWGIEKLSFEERKSKIREAGCCFRCLGKGHFAQQCNAKCSKCKGKHSVVVCYQTNSEKSKGAELSKKPEVPTPEVHSVTCSVNNDISVVNTVLQTARVKVYGDRGFVDATILFDTGSSKSYVSSSLVKRVNPKWVTSEPNSYSVFGGSSPKRVVSNVYDLKLRSKYDEIATIRVNEVPNICTPISRARIPRDVLESFKSFDLADDYVQNTEVSIDILVGLDAYWRFVKPEHHQTENLVAQETIFGWVLSGSWNCQSSIRNQSTEASPNQLCHSTQLVCVTNVPENDLRNFWELESIGIDSKEIQVSELGPDLILKHFNDTIRFVNGRYEVTLPWDPQKKTDLRDNYKLARKRLGVLTRNLDSDQDLRFRYDAVLSEYETLGFITEVKPDEMNVPYPVFYLPHRPVVREGSLTTKVRPVFDASATGFNGISLNDCLHAGPSLNPNLVEILMRFRRWPIALSADITKAFLQIGVNRADQDVHRFLWNRNGNIRIMKFLRVPFGNKSSPFLLNATIRHHLATYPDSRPIEELSENLYVDDLLTGADTDNEATHIASESDDIMSKAGMKFSKWCSNSQMVTNDLVKEFGSKSVISETSKVLGTGWKSAEDVFFYSGVSAPSELSVTKRLILSYIARLFDPLGLLSPFIMTAKILFQDIWRLGLDWDNPVPDPFHAKFLAWLTDLDTIRGWEIPRRYFQSASWETARSTLTLECFGDASEKAYGATVYVKLPRNDGTFETSLVISKSKVAPIKKLTLPRLELLAALLCARLLTFTKRALKLPEDVNYHCWTDSQITLSWIKGDPNRWKTFIANRVVEIQELTSPSNWLYCTGSENPADHITRGLSASELIHSTWLKGPAFLSEIDTSLMCATTIPECPHEVNELSEELAPVNVVIKSENERPVLDITRWGTFTRAVRVTAWVLRFISNLRSEKVSGELSYNELTKAKNFLFRHTQKRAYGTEFEKLKAGKNLSKSSSLYKLDPFIGKDNLLRIKGRLEKSQLSYDEKHPIILPNDHLATLLVMFQHKMLKHAGVETMVSSLRDGYWIVGLRKIAKKVKRECIPCQRIDARPCNQTAAPLPELRVTQAPPFSVTGIDYAGPLFCCDIPRRKLYILLFTCAVIRGVHLEVTDSLNLHDFLLALRRFAARRGLPSILCSDNAKTFEGAERKLIEYFGHNSPQWRFIAPRSPWWGGWWEKLIGSTKAALKKSIGTKCLTRTELETTLHEVEACINSRPLTFVGDELDAKRPLTPAHFLLGRLPGFQVTLSNPDEFLQCMNLQVNPQSLNERETFRQGKLDLFWSLWTKDYLRQLPSVVSKFKEHGELGVGSVVLVHEDNVPRLQWPLGLVTKVLPGSDGKVRCVELRTARGIVLRSVQRLHNLEINRPCNMPPVSESVKTRIGRASRPPDRFVP